MHCCYVCAEGVAQPHARSLVGGSVNRAGSDQDPDVLFFFSSFNFFEMESYYASLDVLELTV